MTDKDMQELARRLVVGHRSDGRCVYDPMAKAELVGACGKPGASVSRLARQCGINTNQLCRWIREHRQRPGPVAAKAKSEAFVALPMVASLCSSGAQREDQMKLQARLPNGVIVEFGELGPQQAAQVIELLGSTRCCAWMKG